jgi:DNA polymerase-4
MAERTWAAWARQVDRDAREGRPARRPRTVVLKLKTAGFQSLTRSLSPPRPPADGEALAAIAHALLDRVALPATTRYRLVGVGLSNLAQADPQVDLFGSEG